MSDTSPKLATVFTTAPRPLGSEAPDAGRISAGVKRCGGRAY